jgi:cobalamin biosynthesis protein CobD/CbiB
MLIDVSSNAGSGLVTGLTTFATAMAALSVASERVTETIKQWLNPLEQKGKVLNWLASDWATQILAVLSGILVIWLSGQDPLALLGFGASQAANGASPSQGGIGALHLILAGFLVAGGSAFWNHVLDIVKATKVQKETTVNNTLPPGQQISS